MSIPLPPRVRGPAGRRLTAAAATGKLELPVCRACGRVQYPPREVCSYCLEDALVWQAVAGKAMLLAATRLHHSNEPYFANRAPRSVGLVALGEGAQAVVHLLGDAAPGETVHLRAMLDRGGEGVLVASGGAADNQEMAMAMHEYTFSPDGRRFAVYAADRRLGDALVTELLACGATGVCRLGSVEVASEGDGRVKHVSLDGCPNNESLRMAVGAVDGLVLAGLGAGGECDARAIAAPGGASALAAAVHRPRDLIDALRAQIREQAGVILHLGSVFALCHLPAVGLESMIQAMARSLIEGERARGHAEGVRVLSLLVGPYGGPATLPLPAATPARIARAAVTALADGLEESTADSVAEDLVTRWRESPKVVERELAALADS